MQLHCANKRKARRLQLASVDPESYLGDVVGMPLAPMRPVYRVKTHRWIERGLPVITAWIGIAVYAVLITIVLFTFVSAYLASVK